MNVLCIRVPSTSRRWALIMIANIVNHMIALYKYIFLLLPLALDETQRIFCLISLLGYPFVGSGLTHRVLTFLSTYNIIGQGCVNIAMMLTQP